MCASKALCHRESCLGENKGSLQWSFKQAQLVIHAFIILRERKRDTQRQKYIRLQNAYQSTRCPWMMKGLGKQEGVTT